MKRTVLLLAGLLSCGAGAQGTQSGVQKWEYGVLLFDARGTYQWVLEKRAVTAETPKALIQKLGGTVPQGVYVLPVVMNVLGAQGWEFVATARSDVGQQYFFKRPRK